jgi:hypothetical protein
MLLMLRMSLAASRSTSQAGDGPTVTSATAAVKRGQSAGSSTTTRSGPASVGEGVAGNVAGRYLSGVL